MAADVLLIRNEENLGNTLAIIQGMKAADAPYVCTLDNDVLLSEGWLTELVAILDSQERIGIVVPSSNAKHPPEGVTQAFVDAQGIEHAKNRGQYVERMDGFFCSVVKRSVMDAIGIWDDVFSPGYYEDLEYCVRASYAGYLVVCAKGAYAYHIAEGSFRLNSNKAKLLKRNKIVYGKMYGNRERILYVVDTKALHIMQSVSEGAIDCARKAHTVSVKCMHTSLRVVAPEHAKIAVFVYSGIFRFVIALFDILRHQKKKYARIFVTNTHWYTTLKLLSCIHRAHVELIPS